MTIVLLSLGRPILSRGRRRSGRTRRLLLKEIEHKPRVRHCKGRALKLQVGHVDVSSQFSLGGGWGGCGGVRARGRRADKAAAPGAPVIDLLFPELGPSLPSKDFVNDPHDESSLVLPPPSALHGLGVGPLPVVLKVPEPRARRGLVKRVPLPHAVPAITKDDPVATFVLAHPGLARTQHGVRELPPAALEDVRLGRALRQRHIRLEGSLLSTTVPQSYGGWLGRPACESLLVLDWGHRETNAAAAFLRRDHPDDARDFARDHGPRLSVSFAQAVGSGRLSRRTSPSRSLLLGRCAVGPVCLSPAKRRSPKGFVVRIQIQV